MAEPQMIVWLLVAGLGYVMVMCMLGTLASHVKHERERHDLVLEARRRRQAYLDKLRDAPDEDDVELV